MTNVTWTDLVNATSSSGTLTLQSNNNWGSRGKSLQTIGRDAGITFNCASNSGNYWVIGLGIDPYGTPVNVEYGFYMTPGSIQIYENGTAIGSAISGATLTSTFKIDVDQYGVVKYYVDGTLAYTSTNAFGATDTGYIHATNYSNPVYVIGTVYTTSTSGSGGSSGGSSGPGQMYTSSGSTAHNENRPLQIFKSQRSWF